MRISVTGSTLRARAQEGDPRGGTIQGSRGLASLELLPSGTFGGSQQHLAGIGTCLEFTPDSLAETVRCPHCGYRAAAVDRTDRQGAGRRAR